MMSGTITVRVNVDAVAADWALAHGIPVNDRAALEADFLSWLDNQARESVGLVSDVDGKVVSVVTVPAQIITQH
jgi:hypothetical protein